MSRLRPLARRRFRTNLPVFVLIRTRKPCVFARFRLFGLNVGCMNLELQLINIDCETLKYSLSRRTTQLKVQTPFIAYRFFECQFI